MLIHPSDGKVVPQCSEHQDAADEERWVSEPVGDTTRRDEDWVIQGGDPTGTGSGGGKVSAEYNNLPFNVGALGVARGPDRKLNSDCQFFIVKTDARFLDGDYTNFGQTIEGMDVVKKIAIGDKMNSVRVEDREA
jgi:cyclophilin family peptidyl-prolyl cis-trans isomerase